MSIEIMLMWLLLIDTIAAIGLLVVTVLGYNINRKNAYYNERAYEDNKILNTAIKNKTELESKLIKQQMEKFNKSSCYDWNIDKEKVTFEENK